MKNISACLSHESDHWSTPSNLYNDFMIKGYIDPCPLHCTEDNLQKEFHNVKLFVNPPFSKLKEWCEWCVKQLHNGCDIWLLMPVRTDTKYFQEILCDECLDIFFVKGRLRFSDSKPAPFPTMLVHLFDNSCGYMMCGDIDLFMAYVSR